VAQPSESTNEGVVRQWVPVLGNRYATMRSAAASAAARAYLGALLILPVVAVVPFIFRNLLVSVVLEAVLLVVSVTWLVFGLLPMYRVAKDFASELRDAGISMNHVPALNSVEIFQRWLEKNNLSGEQIAAICDGRSHSRSDK